MHLNTNVMASTSNQGVEVVDDDIMMEGETSDEFDIEDCDNVSRRGIMTERPIIEYAGEVGPSEPYIGLEFNSSDDGREYYASYGRRNGFTIRVNRKRRSRVDRAVIGYDYVCSKEGFRPKKCLGEDRTIQLSKQSRVGCKAILVIVYRREIEKWVVTNFFREHNHALLGPSDVLVRRSSDDASNEDVKDRRIRELTAELYSERQRFQRKCSAYEERCASYKLKMSKIFKDIELHSEHLTKRVKGVLQTIQEIEDDEEAEDLQSEGLTKRVEGGVVQTIQNVADGGKENHAEHLTKAVEMAVRTIHEDEEELHSDHPTERVEGIIQTIKEVEDYEEEGEDDAEYLMGIELSDLGSLDP